MGLPYLKWFPRDYQAKTRRLRWDEHGPYRMLLDELWMSGGSLPADQSVLARLAGGVPARSWRRIWASIGSFFYVEDGNIRHERIDEELQKVDAIRTNNAAAGKRSASVKRNKNNDSMSTRVERTLNERSTILQTTDTDTSVHVERSEQRTTDETRRDDYAREANRRPEVGAPSPAEPVASSVPSVRPDLSNPPLIDAGGLTSAWERECFAAIPPELKTPAFEANSRGKPAALLAEGFTKPEILSAVAAIVAQQRKRGSPVHSFGIVVSACRERRAKAGAVAGAQPARDAGSVTPRQRVVIRDGKPVLEEIGEAA